MRKDILASAILLLIAACYYAASRSIPISDLSDEVGPNGLPNVLTIVLVVVAVVIGARAFFAPAGASVAEDGSKEAEAPWPRSIAMLAIIALYIPMALVIGYFAELFVIIGGVALYEGAKPSWRLFVVAAGGAGFFWLLFSQLLGVRQPEGLLGGLLF